MYLIIIIGALVVGFILYKSITSQEGMSDSAYSLDDIEKDLDVNSKKKASEKKLEPCGGKVIIDRNLSAKAEIYFRTKENKKWIKSTITFDKVKLDSKNLKKLRESPPLEISYDSFS